MISQSRESIIGALHGTILDSVRISRDLRQTAHVALERKSLLSHGRVVVVGGSRGAPYDGVAVGSPVFSPSSATCAYAGRRGRKWIVVVDGMEQHQCDGVRKNSLRYSPDGTRFSFIGLHGLLFGYSEKARDYVDGDSHISWGNILGATWYVVVDGVAAPRYSEVYDLMFTPDSRHVLYVASKGKKHFLVTDRSEGKAYDGVAPGSLRTSTDGQRMLYLAKCGKKELVVVNGVEAEPGGQITSLPVFSPNGQRVACAVYRGTKQYMMIDDTAETPCDGFIGIVGDRGAVKSSTTACVFSPDSKNLAYVALNGKQCRLMVNGKPLGGVWERFSRTGPVFSPDSTRVAYAAGFGKMHVCLDERELGEYEDVALGSPVFSPDSKRLAYGAKTTRGWCVSVDGEEATSYDNIGNIVFSANSKHVAYRAERAGAAFVVVDGKAQQEYDRILTMPEGSVFFDGNVLKYVGVRGGHVLFVGQSANG